MDAERRRALIDTAVELFHGHGFHAVTVEKVAMEAGVERTEIDAEFATRPALILAALERRDARFREALREDVERCGTSPSERLLAVFDALRTWYESDGFHGCLFINACVEFPDANDPVNVAATRHKQALYDYFRELSESACAEAAHPERADALSQQLVLLMEGAVVTAQVTGRSDAANQARGAAKLLLEHALAERRTHAEEGCPLA